MEKGTRRELLAKLGIGAAAVTAVAVASTAATAEAQVPKLPTKKPVFGVGVRVNPVKPVPVTQLQIRAAVTLQGIVLDAQPSDKIVTGFAKDNRVLQLGVIVDKLGGVEVQGLNSLLDRAAESGGGRCNGNGKDKLEQVSNPADRIVIDQLAAGQMARF